MRHNRESGNNRTTREFLIARSGTGNRDAGQTKRSAVGLEELSRRFPGLSTGKAFVEAAMNRLETAIQFGVLLIRIDRFNEEEDELGPEGAIRLLLDTARAVDRICEPKGAVWGLIERDLFGCFLPEMPDSLCLKAADEIRAESAHQRENTLTIGITEYPLFQFTRIQTLKNARKALNHAAFSGPGGTAVFGPDSLSINADRLYQQGNVEGAISEYKTALLLSPSNPNLHNSLGVCFAALGGLQSALEEFRTASRIDPTEVMPVYNTGLVFRMMGRKETALSRFLEAERLGGNRFEVSFQIARTCQELNRLTQAAAHFDQAVRLKPTSAIAHRLLGECRAALGRTEEAVAAYKKAVKLNPGDAEAVSMLGVLFDKLGENPEIAVLFCRHSVEIAPKNGLYRQRLAKLYLKHTRPDEAMAEFEVAARLGCHSEEESEEEIGPLYPRQTHRAS